MEEVLETTLFEFEKSVFLIDLVKHFSGRQYIKITQTIIDDELSEKRVIKINPSLLKEIVSTLNLYQELIPNGDGVQALENYTKTTKISARTLTELQKK